MQTQFIESSLAAQFSLLDLSSCENITKSYMLANSTYHFPQSLHCTKKFSITDFFSECDQLRRKLRIWSHLLKKSVMESFYFLYSVDDHYSPIDLQKKPQYLQYFFFWNLCVRNLMVHEYKALIFTFSKKKFPKFSWSERIEVFVIKFQLYFCQF